jgi:hypothetical protein
VRESIRGILVRAGVFGVGLLFLVAGAFAHHSAAEFDFEHPPTTITGTVTQFEFINPHVVIHLDVKNEKGETEDWTTFGSPPNALIRIGWNASILKAGDPISIIGERSRYGRHVMLQGKITRANGELLPVGIAEQNYLDRAGRGSGGN